MKFKRTKIVATIGPTSEDSKTLTRLIRAGMNVTRLNFSHGDHAEHLARMTTIRATAKKLGMPIALLQDLSGPKVRIGDFATDSVTLVPGKTLVLTPERIEGTESRVTIGYPHLAEELKKGDVILLDDGRRHLEVTGTRGKDVVTKIIVGGTIKGRRGVNIPGAFKKMSAITAKDKKDLAFGLAQGVDFVAFSFVRTARDVTQLRTLIKKHSPKRDVPIIAKIETPEAVENIDAIIEAADGIMVARGDLAVEVSPERVPFIQKRIIHKCRKVGKPVIIATQMLESMISSPVPTRAEVGDVANAILDGTDAVMLSQETAMGEYPVEAVEMMTKIAHKTENHETYHDIFHHTRESDETELVDAIGRAVVDVSNATRSKAIIAASESGFTARMISRYRPTRPIIVFTPHEDTARSLALSFACHPFMSKSFDRLLNVVAEAKRVILKQELAAKGDHIVIAAGIPFGKVGGTNTMMVQEV